MRVLSRFLLIVSLLFVFSVQVYAQRTEKEEALYQTIKQRIETAVENWQVNIDVSDLNISNDYTKERQIWDYALFDFTMNKDNARYFYLDYKHSFYSTVVMTPESSQIRYLQLSYMIYNNPEVREYSRGKAQKYITNVAKALATIQPGMTEQERVYALYSWIVNRNRYGSGPVGGHTAFDAIVGETNSVNQAVCEGFSNAIFQLFAFNGLEPWLVSAKSKSSAYGHRWARVKVNGLWYELDATVDVGIGKDPSIYYNQFKSASYDRFLTSQDKLYLDNYKDFDELMKLNYEGKESRDKSYEHDATKYQMWRAPLQVASDVRVLSQPAYYNGNWYFLEHRSYVCKGPFMGDRSTMPAPLQEINGRLENQIELRGRIRQNHSWGDQSYFYYTVYIPADYRYELWMVPFSSLEAGNQNGAVRLAELGPNDLKYQFYAFGDKIYYGNNKYVSMSSREKVVDRSILYNEYSLAQMHLAVESLLLTDVMTPSAIANFKQVVADTRTLLDTKSEDRADLAAAYKRLTESYVSAVGDDCLHAGHVDTEAGETIVGVDSVVPDKVILKIYQPASLTIVVEGAEANEPVKIVSITGQVVAEKIANFNGTTLNVNAPGIYIVKTRFNTQKVLIR